MKAGVSAMKCLNMYNAFQTSKEILRSKRFAMYMHHADGSRSNNPPPILSLTSFEWPWPIDGDYRRM